MAGLSFDSRPSNSAFLSAGIFPPDSIADLVFSMCLSVIYEEHGFALPAVRLIAGLGHLEIARRAVGLPKARNIRWRYCEMSNIDAISMTAVVFCACFRCNALRYVSSITVVIMMAVMAMVSSTP